MKQELDEQLCKKYPYIFRDRYAPMNKTCMCWGFPGDGWYDIIDSICAKMMEIKKKTGIQFIAYQVKEKFGGLRFYFSDDGRLLKLTPEERKKWDDEMHEFVNQAEERSYKTCEVCGADAKLRTNVWKRTLCDKCEDEYQNGARW